jgi:predicted transcriptional regulator
VKNSSFSETAPTNQTCLSLINKMAESSFKVVPVTEAEPKKPASSGFKVTPLEQAQGSSGTYRVKSLNPSARFDDLAYVPGDTDQAYDQWREWWVNQEDRDFGLEDAMAIGSTMIGELYDGGKALLANAAEGEVTRILNSIGEGVMRGTADLGIMTLKGVEKFTRDDELTRERFRGWREIRKLEAMREKARRGDEDLIDHLAFSEDPDAFFGYNQTGDVDVDPALAEGASYVTDIGTVVGGAARGLVRKGIGQKAVQLQSKALRGAGKLAGQGMQKVGTIKDNLKAGFAERFPNAAERIGQAKDIATAAGLATNPKAALATRVAVEAADRIGPAGSVLTKSIEDLPELPTNMGGFERVSKNMGVPEAYRATAAGISSAGGDKALRLGKDIGLGATAGGAIGTAMSAASADTDAEFYGGIMGGAFTGGLGGAAGRVVDVVTGKDDAVRMQGSINAFVKEHTGSQDALANMASKSRSALENVVTASEVLRGRVNVKVVGADEFSKLVGDKGAEGFYDKERKEIIINGEGGDPGSTILHEVGEAMWDSGVVDKGLVRSEVVRHYGNLEDLKKAYAKTMLDAELPGKPTDDQIDQRVRELNRKFNDPSDDWVISEMFSEKFMAESSGPGLHNYIRNNSKFGKLKRIAQAAGSPLGNDLKIGRDSLSKAWNEVKGAALDVASQLKGGQGIDGLGFAKDNIFNEDLSKGKKLSKAYKKYSRDLNSQYKAAERGDEPARTVYLDNPDPTIDWDGVGKEYFDDVPGSQGQKKTKSRKDVQQKVRNRRKAVKESLEKAEPSPNVDNVTLKPKYNDKGQVKPGPKEYRGKFLQDTFSGRPEMENFRGAIDTVNQAIADGRVLKSFYFGAGTRQGGDSWVNSVTKNKGNIPVREVDYIPYEWFVSGPGNVGVRVIDLNYMRARVNRWRDTDKLDLWNNDVDAFLDDAKMYLENHRNGLPGDTNLTEEKHAIVNTLFQGNNKGINPFYTAWDRGSGKRLYKTLRIERIGSLKDTDAKGTPFGMGPFDHLKVKKMMSPARGSKDSGKVFARSLEEIQARIPPTERFKGDKAQGQPVTRPNGMRFLSTNLSDKVGDMGLTQDKIDRGFQEAINESGPAAQKAIDMLKEEGFDMKPPGESHWKAAESRPNRDRFWYETSSEAMGISFPDHKGDELGMVMDMIAATSPLADPNYNSELAISIMSEAARNEPSTTPAVVQKSVADVFSGEFGKAEARKVGSFGQTFKFLYGLLDNPPLPTNDRQVAASFGIPDAAFGRFPVLYEVVTRWFNKARDNVNAHRGVDPNGPFQSFQLQAVSWVQTRAESRMERRVNITEEDAFQGDAYANAFKLAAEQLRKAGVQVDKDAETGLPLFTKATLSDPRVVRTLAPLAIKFRENKFGTMEIVTLLHENGSRFADLMEQALATDTKTALNIGDAVVRRGMNRLMNRETVNGDKLPSPISRLFQAMTDKTGEITRLEMGKGTFEGAMSRNIRIPMNKLPGDVHEAFLAYLGEPYKQAAQAASKFDGTNGNPDTYSVFMPGLRDTNENLKTFAEHLSKIGHEANISQRPNGLVIDINPQFLEDFSTKAPEKQKLRDLIEESFPDYVPQISGIKYDSTYIERSDYGKSIKAFEKRLENEYIKQIQEAAGVSRAAAKDLLRRTSAEQPKGKIRNSGRVGRIRTAYVARIRKLQSIVEQLRSAAKDLENDTGAKIPDIEKKLGYDKPKNIIPGINVRNEAEFPYADQIVDGSKTIETRDTDSLKPVVGQRVKIIRTGQGKAEVIGEATIGKPKVYNSIEEFQADSSQHLVGETSNFSFKGQKYGYPIIDPVKYKFPYPAPTNKGRVFTKEVRGTRFSPVRSLNKRGGAVYQNDLGYKAVQTSSRAGVRVYSKLGKRIGPVFGSVEKAEDHLRKLGLR